MTKNKNHTSDDKAEDKTDEAVKTNEAGKDEGQVENKTNAEDGALEETTAKVGSDDTVDGKAAIDATATDKVDEDMIINPDADPANRENPAVNVKTAAAVAGEAGVSTGPGRRNIEEYTKEYRGQWYQVLATVDGKPETSLGFTNDPTGGGLVELADASTNMTGPRVVTLSDKDKAQLTQKAYEAQAKAEA